MIENCQESGHCEAAVDSGETIYAKEDDLIKKILFGSSEEAKKE